MQKKMLWGLGVLVLLICTAFVFMTVRNLAEIRQLKEGTAAAEKPLEDSNKRKPVRKADEQPPAEQGFKWVWHNDHWDKVPVAQDTVPDDTPHAEQNPEAQPLSVLTSTELNDLYYQLAQDISLMNLDEELDSLDSFEFLSKYSPEQRTHLITVGINLSLLPPDVQDKITNYQWRKKGLEMPPTGYTYVKNADGTYRLHKKGEPIINMTDVEIDEHGNFKSASFKFSGEGQTFDEIMKAAEKELNRASSER